MAGGPWNKGGSAHLAEAAADVAFDFRSDVVTVPTESMLRAVWHTTYKDDVHREDATTESFQRDMAAMTGHEAGLFVLSGTMGNGLALRSLLSQPPYAILVDARSNVLNWETGHVASSTGALVQPVEARRNGKYLTLEDILDHVVLDESVTSCPTRVIALENTLHGMIMPLIEVRRIASFAREHGVKLHLDGARLFDASVAGAGSLADYCREFDTVSLCFSKGLGAPVGSMLVAGEQVIRQARKLRQSIGGGLHQAGILTAMARVALFEIFGDGADGQHSVLATCHQKAAQIAELWVRSGGKLLKPAETCMVFLDLQSAGLSKPDLVSMAAEQGLRIMSERLVVHHRKYSPHSTYCCLTLTDHPRRDHQRGDPTS
ncbi:threonine aldolase [Exophiala aquamarina CBS 119918]|uniref:Threonine aldolase n=1 Tax=Exophiala aquamarina CBS 119918 TaxID=1182545 RepID=A0A072PDE3_9EURO|nr:threonine aldolase [Exophiala aquamarina CBS 119918]KEF57881.1 threonine aldolase [Exophiala aquamarina CBS 119918]